MVSRVETCSLSIVLARRSGGKLTFTPQLKIREVIRFPFSHVFTIFKLKTEVVYEEEQPSQLEYTSSAWSRHFEPWDVNVLAC